MNTQKKYPGYPIIHSRVDADIINKFDKLAIQSGHTRASFIRYIIQLFVAGKLKIK